MTLDVKTVLMAVSQYGSAGAQGSAYALEKFYRGPTNNSVMTAAQRALVRSLADSAPSQRPAKSTPHPATQARSLRPTSGRQPMTREKGGDLTPTELMWLGRLPLDPAKITLEDATRLASLHESMSEGSVSARMLVQSIWEPVKLLHDERVARAQLSALRPPVLVSDVPGARNAIADAVAADNPNLNESGLLGQVEQVIAEFDDNQRNRHSSAVSEFEGELSAIEARRVEMSRTEQVGEPA